MNDKWYNSDAAFMLAMCMGIAIVAGTLGTIILLMK